LQVDDELTFRAEMSDSDQFAETRLESQRSDQPLPTSFANKPLGDQPLGNQPLGENESLGMGERTVVDPTNNSQESQFRTTMDAVGQDGFPERTEKFTPPSPFGDADADDENEM
jgi:hypothetical protein